MNNGYQQNTAHCQIYHLDSRKKRIYFNSGNYQRTIPQQFFNSIISHFADQDSISIKLGALVDALFERTLSVHGGSSNGRLVR